MSRRPRDRRAQRTSWPSSPISATGETSQTPSSSARRQRSSLERRLSRPVCISHRGAEMTILTAPVGRLADHVVTLRLPSPDAGDGATVDSYVQEEQLD